MRGEKGCKQGDLAAPPPPPPCATRAGTREKRESRVTVEGIGVLSREGQELNGSFGAHLSVRNSRHADAAEWSRTQDILPNAPDVFRCLPRSSDDQFREAATPLVEERASRRLPRWSRSQ